MGSLFRDLVFYFVNSILNKVPSRSIRVFFYSLVSGGRISRSCSIGLNVRLLDVRKIQIGANTNINYGCTIDGRGAGVYIGNNVDIAPQVNIWSLEHDPDSPNHESRTAPVHISDWAWLANRSIILPGTTIKEGAVVGAGSIVKGKVEKNVIVAGVPAKKLKLRSNSPSFTLKPIRRFR